MAQIPRAALDYLTKEVNALSSDAREKASRLLDSIDWGAADIASARAALVDVLIALVPTYADAAAQAGADFYDALREVAVGEKLGAVAFSGFGPDALDGAVRAFVQDIVDGKPIGRFNRKVLDRIDRDIRRAPNMAVAENARRDPLKPRYARVPSGGETCSFCLMLASRGAVYNTPEAASHAHPGCDCRIVPSFDGGCDIEGYDPDALYSDYLDGAFGTFANKKRVKARNGRIPDYEAYKIMGEWKDRLANAKTIDELYGFADECEKWLKGTSFSGNGTHGTVLSILRGAASRRHGELSVGGHPGIVTYAKPRSELLDHERAGVDWLAKRGCDIETIPEIGDAAANLDIRMGGEDWEMKNVTNGRSSVSNQIARIREKWSKLKRMDFPRGIITCEGCTSSFDDVCDGVRLRLRQGDRFLVISSDGNMREISK